MDRIETMEKPFRKIFRYLEILDENRYTEIKDVEGITFIPTDYKKGNNPPPLSKYKPFKNGDYFGSGKDTHAWFHFTFKVDKANTVLYVNTPYNFNKYEWNVQNPQFILYLNGKMIQGLDINHREVKVDKGEYDAYIYACTGMLAEKSTLTIELRILDPDINGLFYDIKYPFEMVRDAFDPETGEYSETEKYLFNAVSLLDLYDVKSKDFIASVKKAREYLKKEFYGKYCKEQNATVNCIGHTHIDCAWQWRFKQTREKVQRSFSTVLELMRRYPEYKFMSSQALLYKFLMEEAPELIPEIRQRVKEGRWEVEGAMWVEADCDLTSGESLVRQVVYGKNFFKKEFGVDSHIIWLPDVFGYSAALPQILRKCGVDWFVTSKISWNDTNRMPYDTFVWKGIDGTPINSYFLTAQDDIYGKKTVNYSTYVGFTNSPMISGTYKRYQQKCINNEVLLTYGIGDGGGGTTIEMLELLRRGYNGMPGLPNARPQTVNDFLKKVEKNIKDNPELPKWRGELYLEFHRGTYTSQANNKKNNRKSEFLFTNAEALSTIEKALYGAKFPKEELHKGWETILSNQFHDVIPGSSIREVYEDSDVDYANIKKIGDTIVNSAESNIASKIDKKKGYVVFNNNSFKGKGVAKIDGESVFVLDLPSKGYVVTDKFIKGNSVKINGNTVETKAFKVKFDKNWQLKSVFDKKADREMLVGLGNELRLYADHPNVYDAWEWEEHSKDQYKVISAFESATVVEDGIKKGIKIKRKFGKSSLTQTVWFYDDMPVIDFETEVDWHERHNMLKTAFDTGINAEFSTQEIQFGTVERPTHFNTSWDKAKFETCAHKYVDLSDNGYGVSLLNDCKYGYDVHEGVIQLSLLRSPTNPDPEADQGKHTFTYSVYSHEGAFKDADTARYAYALNNPLEAVKASGKTSTIPETFSLISVNKENIVCETVKEEENGTATIFRLYEYKNMKTKAEITFGAKYKKVYVADMMENVIKELPVKDGKVKYEFNGFEILTLKAE